MRIYEDKKKLPRPKSGEFFLCWHLPILPGRFQPSIVGTSELNCRVRDGNGCTLTVISTNYVAKAYSTLAGVPQKPSELNKVTLKRMMERTSCRSRASHRFLSKCVRYICSNL